MTAEFDDHALQNGIDTAFEYGGLLLRALGYAALYAVASNYDCGRPMLAGVLAGDLVSHVVLVFLRWHDSLLTIASELALTALVVLLVRDQLAWPAELPMRAIFGLAAFGACIGKFPGAFTTLGRP
ncbi:MAG: hypothetical protein H6838_02160 [Planctomycetes bacterium]|nr:hypothetical protein [Planctomycetota bacterium]MCB9884263.1 hypothetical protein [Planctomycetota bacterium]